MSKSKLSYGVYNGKALKEFLENSGILFLTVFFSIGILVGSLVCKTDSSVYSDIQHIIGDYLEIRNEQGIADNLFTSLCINLTFNLSCIFLAFSLIGYPFLLWIPFIRGLGIGMLSGLLYSLYRFTGLGYCVLTVYPAAAVYAIVLILSCNDSCIYSKNAYAKALRGRGQFERDETKIFLTRQFIYILVCAVSSVIDAFSNALFSGLFEI